MTDKLYKMIELNTDGVIQREEYLPPGSIVKVDSIEAMRQRAKMKEQREKREYLRDSNPFTFIETNEIGTMRPETLTKLIYLSTFIKFNNPDLMKTERKKLYKADLSEVLKISKKQCKVFLDETTAAGMLYVGDDDSITINTTVFCRRSLKPEMFNKYTRAYAKGIRSLYDSVSVRQHKQLGYIFLMLPYLNRTYNVLCHPDDILLDDAKAIRTIAFSEFCDLIGYNRKNAYRLKLTYKKLKFSDKDGYIWDFVRIIDSYGKIYINPNIFYAGDDIRRVELLDTLFS